MNPAFHIGSLLIHGDAILSPMDGFSDWPFRSICRELGSAVSYTEFIKAEDIVRPGKKTRDKLYFDPAERPVAIQLYGDDPDRLLEAALRAQELEPDFIDINMGCPSKSIAHRGAGVGLMRAPLKVARVFRRLSASLEIPLTGKIRLGWEDCKNYRLIARIVEENGGQALAIHGRTKEQGYAGRADWDAIAEVVAALSIPVIGNGDVKIPADIARMKAHTGCAAVMIGRAAIGNPWIFAGQERGQVTSEQVREVMLTHLERNLVFYGAELGLVLFRKHAVRYISSYRLPGELRRRLLTCERPEAFTALLDEIAAAVV